MSPEFCKASLAERRAAGCSSPGQCGSDENAPGVLHRGQGHRPRSPDGRSRETSLLLTHLRPRRTFFQFDLSLSASAATATPHACRAPPAPDHVDISLLPQAGRLSLCPSIGSEFCAWCMLVYSTAQNAVLYSLFLGLIGAAAATLPHRPYWPRKRDNALNAQLSRRTGAAGGGA